MNQNALFWEDVEEGQELAPFTYEMSLLRLVAAVRASGLYDYIHFDRDFARSVGAKDAFASNSHLSGLFSRLITDWAGPDADIRSMGFNMRAQCCAGDVLTVSGKVGRKFMGEDGACLIELAPLNIATQDVPAAANAMALIALPSRQHGQVPARTDLPAEETALDANDVPDFARHLIGVSKEITYRSQPLAESELHLWCEAVEDWNPAYWDRAYAASNRYGALIAPPLSHLYGAGSSADIGVGYGKPGCDTPNAVRNGLSGIPLLNELRKVLIATQAPIMLPEFPQVVISDSRIECFRPFRVGDSLRAEQRMTSCGPLKKTKLGEGHFFSWVNAEYNQQDELVRTVSYTMFLYRSA